MRLNKEEIQFIDNYLIENGVKYWDVRIELLDHIVSSVEERMDSGLLFNDALLQVHEGFGNKLGNYRNPTFEQKLYYSNRGFKKFMKLKQKEIGRKNRREYWLSFMPFLWSKKFIIEYCALIALVRIIFRYNPKWACVVFLIIICLPALVAFFYFVFEKAARKSLNLNIKMVLYFTLMSNSYLAIYPFSFFNKEEFSRSYIYLIVLYLVLFPFLRHSISIYKSMLKTYKSRYNLMFS